MSHHVLKRNVGHKLKHYQKLIFRLKKNNNKESVTETLIHAFTTSRMDYCN